MDNHEEKPIDVAIVLDTSGSMDSRVSYNQSNSQTRLVLSVKALKTLLNHLRADDSISLAEFKTKLKSWFLKLVWIK
eukprot:UN03200